MSNQKNLAAEILAMWQKQTQEYLNDPKSAQTIVEHYAKFQETLKQFVNKASDADAAADDVDAGEQLSKFAERIAELEARVKILERTLAANLDRSAE